MKTKAKIDRGLKGNTLPTFCLNSCRQLLGQIEKVKSSVLREFAATVAGHRRLLELGMKEAEALAWQTAYPHLFFPILAEEKAAAISHWAARQRTIRGNSFRLQQTLEVQAR